MKIKNFLFKLWKPFMSVSLVITSLSTNVFPVLALSEFYSTNEGVSVTFTPRKSSYELGEKIEADVKFTNHNDHQMKMVNPEVSLNDYNVKLPINDEIGANETLSKTVDLDLTFEQWHSVKIKDQSIKVGIQARKDIIDSDSIFHVETVDESNPNYNTYLNWVDPVNGEIEHIALFNMSLTDKLGRSFQPTGGANVYFEVPEGWDANELQASYINSGIDEQFDEKIVEIDGVKYLCWRIDHFSPYAVIDPVTEDDDKIIDNNDNKNNDDSKEDESSISQNPDSDASDETNGNIKTGDEIIYIIVGLIAFLVSLAFIFAALRYKKLMSVFYCFFIIFSFGFCHNESLAFFEEDTYTVNVLPNQTSVVTFDGVKIKVSWSIKHPVIKVKQVSGQTTIFGDFDEVEFNADSYDEYDVYDDDMMRKKVDGEFNIDSNFGENLMYGFYKDGKLVDSYQKT